MIVLQSTALLFLLACSAFFSGSEAAITALSAWRMKRLSLLRPELAAYFNEWLSRPHRLLVTILVGNNVVNIAISSLSATLAAALAFGLPRRLVEVGVWLAVTAVLLVFGEITPKIVGRAYRERVSELSLPILRGLSRALFIFWGPLGWAIDKWTPGLHEAPVNRLTALSLEELHHVINESQASGQMPAESGEMMRRVLSLPQRSVATIRQAVENVDSVPLEVLQQGKKNASDLFVDLLIETGRTRVPVTRGGAPAGYVHLMDLLKEWRTGRVKHLEALVRPASRVRADKGVFEVLEHFQKTGEHMVFVEDEGGKFIGLATLEDVLEEIVGEILDEYDIEEKKGQ